MNPATSSANATGPPGLPSRRSSGWATPDVVWSWDSDPFGNTAANEDPNGLGAFSFNLRFPGQYYDAETGLNYNYNRVYDPAVGRYVEPDPIALVGGTNQVLLDVRSQRGNGRRLYLQLPSEARQRDGMQSVLP